jgi:hypothetical protein
VPFLILPYPRQFRGPGDKFPEFDVHWGAPPKTER